MKEIPLTRGMVALVDDEDYDAVNRFKWCAHKHRRTFYANRNEYKSGKAYHKLMHRVILGLNNPRVQTDHKDGNGLNNQKYNLRICSNAQNQWNTRKRLNAASQFKGVTFHDERWRARITVHGKQKYIGHFSDEIEAARAYDSEAKLLFGEFAALNFKT